MSAACGLSEGARASVVCTLSSFSLPGERQLAEPQTTHHEKGRTTLIGLSGFLRQHIPRLSLLLQHSSRVTHQASSFRWEPEPRAGSAASPGRLQAAMPFGPCDPAGSVTLTVSPASKGAVTASGRRQDSITARPLGL